MFVVVILNVMNCDKRGRKSIQLEFLRLKKMYLL